MRSKFQKVKEKQENKKKYRAQDEGQLYEKDSPTKVILYSGSV